ncbi:MAG: PHP domain-containing protein [Clostridia bacterium]|nr:PHP domain-containing protein [Clostridia bacterium]
MIASNVHTHTVFSDGKNTPEEMVAAAREKGFVSLGISDHSDTPFDPTGYCMEDKDYGRYLAALRGLQERLEGEFELFCGMEKDYYSPIDASLYDYVIGSVHYVPDPNGGDPWSVDMSRAVQEEYVAKCCGGEKLELAKRYFELVVRHAETEPFLIQGHFDLVNKFGLFDDESEAYRHTAREALRAVAPLVPYFEINTGAMYRGYRTAPYPAPFLLEEMQRLGVKPVLNGDSHDIPSLDHAFAETEALLKKTGFSSLWRMRRGGMEEILL